MDLQLYTDLSRTTIKTANLCSFSLPSVSREILHHYLPTIPALNLNGVQHTKLQLLPCCIDAIVPKMHIPQSPNDFLPI